MYKLGMHDISAMPSSVCVSVSTAQLKPEKLLNDAKE